LIDWIKVLHPTQYKIGRLRDASLANLLAGNKKSKSKITNATSHREHKDTTTAATAAVTTTTTTTTTTTILWHFVQDYKDTITQKTKVRFGRLL